MRTLALTMATTLLMMVTWPAWAAERGFLIVASGIGGEPVYSQRFAEWSKTMIDAAVDRMGVPRQRIVYLAETGTDGADAESRKSELEFAIDRFAFIAEAGDVVFLLLIGHGTARGDRLLFNLPGPDLSATELAAMLERQSDIR